jgi:hypothetical protein
MVVHDITQNATRRLRIATQQQPSCLVQQCFRERWITLGSSNNCILEIARERHSPYLYRFLALTPTGAGTFGVVHQY